MRASGPIAVRNGQSVPRTAVPRLAPGDFLDAVAAAPAEARRVAALFGAPALGGAVELTAVLADDEHGTMHLATTVVEGDAYPAVTPRCMQAHLFEREIAEQWGLRPEGHAWMKPVRFVRSGRPGHDAWARGEGESIQVGVMDFYRVDGEEIHEVAVGPVHAGVIEPGHFRFQCHGEHVFHLEISLGYQHRGVERALVGGPDKRTLHYMETLAGDTTVGHATAYCQIVEALAACRVSARAHALRAVALELERMANHTGGLGALAGDVGFLPTAAYCGRLRGDFLNLTATLCGNRFGRSFVRPGGVEFDVDEERVAMILSRLDAAMRDVESAVSLLMEAPSVQARFEDTGRVEAEVAAELGIVGVAARASGVPRDVRHDHPAGIYRFAQIPVSVWHSGDVFARAHVRWKEIQRSATFIREQLRELPKGSVLARCAALAPDHVCIALVEGWRGEICHVAMTDEAGRYAVYKIVDPSFHNWSALAVALRDQQISDFPLCNKSFDLSYCGHDL